MNYKRSAISENDFSNIWVCSDIHGYFDLFQSGLQKISLSKNDLLIVNGDSCDRGKETGFVYDKIIQLTDSGYNVIHIKGNHEDMFWQYFVLDSGFDLYIQNGGGATIEFYKNSDRCPDVHLKFVELMPHVVETENHIIVHAGIRPEIELEDQSENDLMWIKEEFIGKPLQIKKTVVFGHSAAMNGKVVFYQNNSVGIDCGTYVNKKLAFIELKTKKIIYSKITEL